MFFLIKDAMISIGNIDYKIRFLAGTVIFLSQPSRFIFRYWYNLENTKLDISSYDKGEQICSHLPWIVLVICQFVVCKLSMNIGQLLTFSKKSGL